MVNTYLLYFGAGIGAASFSGAYLSTVAAGFLTIIMLFFINTLVNLSFVVRRALFRKNMLRISLLIMLVAFAISLIMRIVEVSSVYFALHVGLTLYYTL